MNRLESNESIARFLDGSIINDSKETFVPNELCNDLMGGDQA